VVDFFCQKLSPCPGRAGVVVLLELEELADLLVTCWSLTLFGLVSRRSRRSGIHGRVLLFIPSMCIDSLDEFLEFL